MFFAPVFGVGLEYFLEFLGSRVAMGTNVILQPEIIKYFFSNQAYFSVTSLFDSSSTEIPYIYLIVFKKNSIYWQSNDASHSEIK